MGFTITPLIVAVSIVLVSQCCGVNSVAHCKIELGPKKIAPGSVPLEGAGYMIQQVTQKIHNVGQIYYFQRKREIIYPNRVFNGSIYAWHQNNGSITCKHFKELNRETPATITPLKHNQNEFIIGSDRNLRLITKTETDLIISKPLLHFDNPGFVIYSAHCDANGIMFILLIGTEGGTKHLGKLYKIKNRNAVLVKELYDMPRDFRFNFDCTSMFIVHDYGRKISQIKYDIQTTDLGQTTTVFDMNEYPILSHHIMKGVAVDRYPGHLWVTAAGKEGYVLEINPFTKKLGSLTSVPNKDLTFATFGNDKYSTLFVGSKSTCTKGKAQGTIYAMSGMGKYGAPDFPIKW